VAKYAPERPSTEELRGNNAFSPHTVEAIAQKRIEVSRILRGAAGLLAMAGPCAPKPDRRYYAEAGRIAQLGDETPGLATLNRMPPWKPRSNPNSWHGMESDNPWGAYQMLHALAATNANVALEVATPRHMDRYGPLSSLVWVGARTTDKGEGDVIKQMAAQDPLLPFAIKNGLDGQLEPALALVDAINAERGPDGAPAVLLYRGGENAKTPSSWAEIVRHAVKETDGQVIVDVAHGGEMAHDLSGQYGKSELGQIACIATLAEVMREGFMPAGVIMETSDVKSPVDPTISLDYGLAGIQALHTVSQP
jgi:phospho-2-dehydro-3-deoxyheptonate aldolase